MTSLSFWTNVWLTAVTVLAVSFVVLTWSSKQREENAPEQPAAVAAPEPAKPPPDPIPAVPASARARTGYHQEKPEAVRWEPLAPDTVRPLACAARPIPLTGVDADKDRLTGLVVGEAARRAAVIYVTWPMGGQPVSRLVVCDLKEGKVLTSLTVPGAHVPLALSPDGRRLLVRQARGLLPWAGPSEPLLLWTLADDVIQKTESLELPKKSGGQVRHWAAFCAGGKLAVQADETELAVYDAATLRPEVFVKTDHWGKHGVSRDGKYIAFLSDENRLCVLDVAAGRVVAHRPLDEKKITTESSGLVFSPSGRLLLWSHRTYKYVFDTATGQVVALVSRSDSDSGGTLVFPSEEYFLVGGLAKSILVHATEQWVAWSYRGIAAAQPVGDVCWAVVCQPFGHDAALVPLTLPHSAAQAALGPARGPDFYALREGTPVRLDVSGIPDAARREEIRGTLTAKLNANGNPLRDDAAVVLSARIDHDRAKPLRYSLGGQTLSDTYRPTRQVLEFLRQGERLWYHGRLNKDHPPFQITLKPGETTLAGWVEWMEEPDYDFFPKAALPRVVTKLTVAAPTSNGLGEWDITPHGTAEKERREAGKGALAAVNWPPSELRIEHLWSRGTALEALLGVPVAQVPTDRW